ncbi:MAG: helix-hairpin-helix domain-containing protein, partial [Anaerolineales bacterium]|nr:helix-hairpin-helix domain-containing protein [Anaerolineales bacterium]
METISGSIERITYYNPENGYSVIRLRPEKGNMPGSSRQGLVTAVGNLPELTPGEYVSLQGNWANHPRHGLQFQIEFMEQSLPATVAGIQRYLGSGLIKGIGPRLAERIVEQFGEDTLEVIDNHPDRLTEVQDIGPKRYRMIARAWEEQRQVKEIMVYLHGHGVSTNLAIKIFKQYGDMSMQVVSTDPYRLARDIHGVGFKTADRLARDLGIPSDHPSRIQAGVVYALNQMVDDGHVYVPEDILTSQAVDLLSVEGDLIGPAIDALREDDRVRLDLLAGQGQPKDSAVRENPAVYLTPLYHGETGVAARLGELARTIPSRLSTLPPALIEFDPGLSQEQRQAIQIALTHPVSILTGGPGTGKTRSIQALVGTLEQGHKHVALCAPTGRAAKRLSEATGRPASTIHRLLEYSPRDGFGYHDENPLPVDLIVVDEASMLDLLLTNNLLKALEPGTHILFVGDVDQLPSVGAGDVL